jgi:cellulose synthase/poly-beta-1,6-N-acetylglucosamine synthase-like glycosyltransferase
MNIFPSFELNSTSIICCVFLLMALTQLIYVIFIHGKLSFYKIKEGYSNHNYPPISIIISARNESDNLFENLPAVLEQDYPNFEVIVVNHQSIDESYNILNAYAQQFPNLRVIEVERSQHLKPGKKLPLTIGIKGAKFEHLVFTDADCKPSSSLWLKSMSSQFSDSKEIVLGYGPYIKRSGLLNKIIRFDTSWIAMNYFSMALAKYPYMGVGRNLAYTKNVFNSVNGFKSHYSITSGDDDLFIQESATKNNFAINLNPDSYCYSEGSSSWGNWYLQKTRHFTTSSRYNVFKKALLGIYPLSLLILMISFVTLLFDEDFRWFSLICFVFVLILKWWIQGKCFIKLHEKSFIKFLPLYDLAYAIILPILFYTTDKNEIRKW